MATMNVRSFYGRRQQDPPTSDDNDTDDESYIPSDLDEPEVDDDDEDCVVNISDIDLDDSLENEESDESSSESEVSNEHSGKLVAKSGRSYRTTPPRAARRTVQNIIREREGLTADGKVDTTFEAFQKFITDDLLKIIVEHSNEEADNKNLTVTTAEEVRAFIGLILTMGANGDTKQSNHDLWSDVNGRSIYKVAMSRCRFQELLCMLRFDSKETRDERKKADKFAPFREVFNQINATLPKYYLPGEHTTIDEMLSLFRGRCPFKVFMKDKPGKYGMLIRMLSDSHTRYVLNMEPYSGKSVGVPAHQRRPTETVKRLVQPIINSGRNVTTDRYYTSVELADSLWSDFKLTLVGTLQLNRKHIPEELKSTRQRELYSSVFAFTEPSTGKPPVTLVSYCIKDKPKKLLLLLSTQHQDAAVDSGEKKKTDINLYYNSTKGGIDTIDQMARKYSCKRGTRRWPLSLFYTMIDIAALNAYALFTLNKPEWKVRKKNRRRLFLLELGLELIKPYLEKRAEHPVGLQRSLLQDMGKILGRDITVEAQPNRNTDSTAAVTGRCHICWSTAANKRKKLSAVKSRHKCNRCEKFVCGKHSEKCFVCSLCSNENNSD